MTRSNSAMPRWKQLTLGAYYHASRPYRVWARCRAARGGRVPIVVLFYHRVADEMPNDWTVSNAMFTRQIDWLQSHFELISLDEAQRRLRDNYNNQPAVCLTFDDGYADNCRHAIPLLIKRRIPCTYYATLENVLTGRPFQHDAALGNDVAPNTIEQLRAMADAGVEIGGHGRRHVDLGTLRDPARLYDEVVVAREDLQRELGRPVRHFAFPFGQYINLSSEAFALAKRAGYESVCSAYGGYNFPGDDPFHLQRIHVDNDMIRLKNRATVDPRRVSPPRFRYHDAVVRIESTASSQSLHP